MKATQAAIFEYADLLQRRSCLDAAYLLTETEMFCIRSLIYYAAAESSVKEKTVEMLLADYFGGRRTEALERAHYERAVDFLLNVGDMLCTLN